MGIASAAIHQRRISWESSSSPGDCSVHSQPTLYPGEMRLLLGALIAACTLLDRGEALQCYKCVSGLANMIGYEDCGDMGTQAQETCEPGISWCQKQHGKVDGKSVSIRSCGEAALCPALQKGCHKQNDAETDGYTIKHNKVCCCLGELCNSSGVIQISVAAIVPLIFAILL